MKYTKGTSYSCRMVVIIFLKRKIEKCFCADVDDIE